MKRVLLFITVLVSVFTMSAGGDFGDLFHPHPISFKSERDMKQLQAELKLVEGTLGLLDERAKEGRKGPEDDLVRQDCQERKDLLFNRLQRAKREYQKDMCCTIV